MVRDLIESIMDRKFEKIRNAIEFVKLLALIKLCCITKIDK